MFILLTSILKQKPVQIVKKKIDWQKLLRYAEYHDVITLFYYAVLGIEKELAGKWEETLYHKYKKELLHAVRVPRSRRDNHLAIGTTAYSCTTSFRYSRYDLYYPKEMGDIDIWNFW